MDLWYGQIGDTIIVDAILDPLMHNACKTNLLLEKELMRMKLFRLLMTLSFFLFFQLFVNSGHAEKEGKLPIFPDATEKVCSEHEGGACLESPTLRVQFSTSDNLAAVVRKLLNKSKKYGWKMYKINGLETPRYQSSNSKGFVLLWSVEPISTKSDKSSKTTYNIYYWKIYGE